MVVELLPTYTCTTRFFYFANLCNDLSVSSTILFYCYISLICIVGPILLLFFSNKCNMLLLSFSNKCNIELLSFGDQHNILLPSFRDKYNIVWLSFSITF